MKGGGDSGCAALSVDGTKPFFDGGINFPVSIFPIMGDGIPI